MQKTSSQRLKNAREVACQHFWPFDDLQVPRAVYRAPVASDHPLRCPATPARSGSHSSPQRATTSRGSLCFAVVGGKRAAFSKSRGALSGPLILQVCRAAPSLGASASHGTPSRPSGHALGAVGRRTLVRVVFCLPAFASRSRISC